VVFLWTWVPQLEPQHHLLPSGRLASEDDFGLRPAVSEIRHFEEARR